MANKIAITTEKTGAHRVIATRAACSVSVRDKGCAREVHLRVRGKGPAHARSALAELLKWVLRSYDNAFIHHQTVQPRSWHWTGPCVNMSIKEGDRIVIGASVHPKKMHPQKRTR